MNGLGSTADEFSSTSIDSLPSSATMSTLVPPCRHDEKQPLTRRDKERPMMTKKLTAKRTKSTPSPNKKTSLRNVFTILLPFVRFDKPKMKPTSREPSEKSVELLVTAINTVDHGKVIAQPYDWPIANSMDRSNTALVVIDMQVDFCSPGGYIHNQGYSIDGARAIIPNVQRLLASFRKLDMPVYFTREGHRADLSTLSHRERLRSKNNDGQMGIGDAGPLGRLLIRGEKGWELIPELGNTKEDHVIDKPGRSAFQHTEFGLMLNIRGLKNLVLCGVTTDVCVHSTMRDANDNAFDCVLVEDACAAAEKHLHDGAVESVKAEGGIFGAVTTTENLVNRLEQIDLSTSHISINYISAAGVDLPTTPRPLKQPPKSLNRATKEELTHDNRVFPIGSLSSLADRPKALPHTPTSESSGSQRSFTPPPADIFKE